MEKKGIISDRCELNRQIDADNALLRALKAQVKKLAELVKGGVAAIAEMMEAVRQKMILFRYHILHTENGKKQITDTLQVIQPDIRQYESIIKKLKAKIWERRTLLEERRSVPAIQIFRQGELAQKIAKLTEDIEEQKGEKALLLNQFHCTDDQGMLEVKQRIAAMESSLEKMNQQETRYTDKLNAALTQYTELQQQAADLDAVELDAARQAFRPDMEHGTTRQLQDAYGRQFEFQVLTQSRKDVGKLLDEATEPVSIRECLRQTVEQQDKRHYKKDHIQER